MRRLRSIVLAVAVFTGMGELAAQTVSDGSDQPARGTPEKRIAFVVGNGSYEAGALPTAANDAGLIAQTLQAAGFDVIGARDLDAETLRQSYVDFLKRVADAGPDSAAFVYLAGYGLQYGNENYYVPIGASLSRETDIPIQAIRLSDFTGPLTSMKSHARFLVFDAAYQSPFHLEGAAVGGFALADPPADSLLAYNAAPGTVAPVGTGSYGSYAQSLAAQLREGGSSPDDIFEQVRLRTSDASKGAETPWAVSKVEASFRFFERTRGAPAPAVAPEQRAALTTQPIATLPVRKAYTAAVARDTVKSYADFIAAYGGDPLARRARALLAARREAVTWHRTTVVDTAAAYWSYLSRYPKGPHAGAAQARLDQLSAPIRPPVEYRAIAYDLPPPPAEELRYVDAPVLALGDPGYGLLPPPPDEWLPPLPVAFLDLPPPPPPPGLFLLPTPDFVGLPAYIGPPPFIAFPPNNYFFGGLAGGGAVFISSLSVVINIHQSIKAGPIGPVPGGIKPLVALPVAAKVRTTALQQRGVTTPAQLRAARLQPGGLAGAGSPGKALPIAQQLPRTDPSAAPPGRGAGGQGSVAPSGVKRPVVPAQTRVVPTFNPTPTGSTGAGRPTSNPRVASRGRGFEPPPKVSSPTFASKRQPLQPLLRGAGRVNPRPAKFTGARIGGGGRVASPAFSRGGGGPRVARVIAPTRVSQPRVSTPRISTPRVSAPRPGNLRR